METSEQQKISPMMLQWHACKKKVPNAILFFRMGDFYEAFYEDAVLVSKELDLTLTKRVDIPMSGVPHHTCDGYIDKLVAKGYRVAVAEQTEDAKKAKGLVKRDVVRVVTPGTLISSSLLPDKSNNYIASLDRIGSTWGLAILDLTTAEFFVLEFEKESDLLNEVFRYHPAEFIISGPKKEKLSKLFEEIRKSYHFLLTELEDWHYDHQIAHDTLINHFKVLTLDGFGLKGMIGAINAAGALLYYIRDHLSLPVHHLEEIRVQTTSNFMSIDRHTESNLELTESLREGSQKNSLLALLDKTKTPMGARLLRQWIKHPLLSPAAISLRQGAIEALFTASSNFKKIGESLNTVRDLERLMIKIEAGYATPRDIVSLKNSLEPIPFIKEIFFPFSLKSELLKSNVEGLIPLPDLVGLITNALVDDPPLRITDGGVFRDGYNKELDELRELKQDSKAWLARYQNSLREETGIKTLKVGYNKMFGYYIEVSKGQKEKMPATFERRQTLVNGERYITPELKNYESKVLNAEERISGIEMELFLTLRQEVAKYFQQVQKLAKVVAHLDVIQSLSFVAHLNNYVRPIIDDSTKLEIIDGRHPIIEVANSFKFIPNDTLLNQETCRMMLITGPNMAGKSTYIRQVALIVILAQMGSFVPARSAHMGIVDTVFTRIGASDDLSRGQSTFMVEMTETANILNNATSRSLIILDEIGRGTSTYDGISIAWAVAEFLLTSEDKFAKTLFATHYFELTKLEEKVPGAVNYNVAVHESEDNIIFLRKIVRGGTDKSYGIHVGRLAGLPQPVISRAKEILVHLEENANRKNAFEPPKQKKALAKPKIPNSLQLTLFS